MKKRLTKKEKEAAVRKGLVIAAAVFAALTLAAIVLGVVFSAVSRNEDRKAEEREKISYTYLRKTMESLYKEHPWDGKDPSSVSLKEGEVWVYYEMLMAIEDDGMRAGSRGIEYDRSAGDTLCVDLSGVENEETRRAIGNMFKDYCACKNGLVFRTGSREDLVKEGKISKSNDGAYTEGCLLQFGNISYDEETGRYGAMIHFFYSDLYGRGAEVSLMRKSAYEQNEKALGTDDKSVISDDGSWVACVLNTLIA